jgi:putative membrane protein
MTSSKEAGLMMYWDGGHAAYWQIGLMWLGMLVFWGLVIWAGYLLITTLARTDRPIASREGPREILERRLASGEIDVDEYRRRREAIESPIVRSATPGTEVKIP